MTVIVYSWVLPAVFTLLSAVAFGWWMAQENAPGLYIFAVRPFIALPGWVILSLVAWLIWAVLT